MAFDPHLAEPMRPALKRRAGITEKKMFGGICWTLNGNLLRGVEVGRYMFRVGKAREAEAMARPGAVAMDLTGRRRGGLVWADAAIEAPLGRWNDLAAGFVGALPPK